MLNKEWFPERFQEVVNRLHREIKFIQIGSSGDPPLLNAIDLRGKTSIRASAAILSQARLFVGIEGFVMHIARAMECPAVIVLGGRTAPWQFGYTCNVNLYSPLPCSPCWLWNRCDYGRACLDMITTEDVINGIKQVLGSPRGVLAVDKTVI
jgi:ADP-heptose:LPS heptosyltransferase